MDINSLFIFFTNVLTEAIVRTTTGKMNSFTAVLRTRVPVKNIRNVVLIQKNPCITVLQADIIADRVLLTIGQVDAIDIVLGAIISFDKRAV